jgi:hypothetical protein
MVWKTIFFLLVALPCSTIRPGAASRLSQESPRNIFWDPFGADSDLREHGLRLAREGTAKGQEAGRRRCRTKARRIAPHALEIP